MTTTCNIGLALTPLASAAPPANTEGGVQEAVTTAASKGLGNKRVKTQAE